MVWFLNNFLQAFIKTPCRLLAGCFYFLGVLVIFSSCIFTAPYPEAVFMFMVLVLFSSILNL